MILFMFGNVSVPQLPLAKRPALTPRLPEASNAPGKAVATVFCHSLGGLWDSLMAARGNVVKCHRLMATGAL